MQNLHDMLKDVMMNCEYLEESMKTLPESSYMRITPPTSNLATLSTDSDKLEVFQDSLNATRRIVKIRGKLLVLQSSSKRFSDFAMSADRLLQQRALKRSNYPHAAPQSKVSKLFPNLFVLLFHKKNYKNLESKAAVRTIERYDCPDFDALRTTVWYDWSCNQFGRTPLHHAGHGQPSYVGLYTYA